jgi:hypothetical protein
LHPASNGAADPAVHMACREDGCAAGGIQHLQPRA